ncbi:MAG: hypothetical protein RJB38_2181 [Pseudomonadota bacterium]|jgi:hypothetical protein
MNTEPTLIHGIEFYGLGRLSISAHDAKEMAPLPDLSGLILGAPVSGDLQGALLLRNTDPNTSWDTSILAELLNVSGAKILENLESAGVDLMIHAPTILSEKTCERLTQSQARVWSRWSGTLKGKKDGSFELILITIDPLSTGMLATLAAHDSLLEDT